MPYINKAFADESIAKGGTAIAEEKIFRRMSDTSTEQPFIDSTTGKVDGTTNRTSYLMNSLLSHKTRRHGRWTFPRFQRDIGTANFVAFHERNSEVMDTDPNAVPRQDDYDVWLGTYTRSTTGSSGSNTATRIASTWTATSSQRVRPRPTWGCTSADSSSRRPASTPERGYA
jgi:hypothetical protein